MDWSTKAKAMKAWRAMHPIQSRAGRELERSSERVATSVAGAATRVAKKAVPAVVAAAPAIASAAASGAGLIAAGALSYFLTRAAAEGPRINRENKMEWVNNLYRHAVAKMRAELGRDPTAAEVRPLSDEWKRRRAEIEANVPVMLRPGRE